MSDCTTCVGTWTSEEPYSSLSFGSTWDDGPCVIHEPFINDLFTYSFRGWTVDCLRWVSGDGQSRPLTEALENTGVGNKLTPRLTSDPPSTNCLPQYRATPVTDRSTPETRGDDYVHSGGFPAPSKKWGPNSTRTPDPPAPTSGVEQEVGKGQGTREGSK